MIENLRLGTGIVLLAGLWNPTTSRAEAPQLAFDVPAVIECYDLTTPAFAASNPDEKLVGATISLSLLMREGGAEQIDELLVVVESPGRRAAMVDFCPRTETVSDIAGPVATTATHERKRSLDTGVSVPLTAPLGALTAGVTPNISATRSHADSYEEHFEKLPPRMPLVTSGTTHDGHGVFFKFRATSQVTLEGAREVRCLLAVPRDWRGDCIVVRCEARYRQASLWGRQDATRTTGDRLVGLYLAGDNSAKFAAHALESALARRASAQASSSLADSLSLISELRGGLLGGSNKSHAQARADRDVKHAVYVLASLSGGSLSLAQTDKPAGR